MDEVIRRGIVPDISWSSVQWILAGLEVKPHKTEQWFHSPDPEFRPKVTAICDLYLKPPPAGSVVLCIDEKPGIQALARAASPIAHQHPAGDAGESLSTSARSPRTTQTKLCT